MSSYIDNFYNNHAYDCILSDVEDLKDELIMYKGQQNETIACSTNIPKKYKIINALTPVKNQGKTSSCVAQVLACMKEFEEFNKDNQCNISPEFIYNERKNKDKKGMSIRDGLRILKEIGCCETKNYSYDFNTDHDIINKIHMQYIYAIAENYKIKDYKFISSILDVKHTLVTSGACAIVLPVYNSDSKKIWRRSFDSKFLGYHAMTIVGYNKKGFILRNSWGEEWCNKGYIIFPYSDFGLHREIWSIEIENKYEGDISEKWYHKFIK